MDIIPDDGLDRPSAQPAFRAPNLPYRAWVDASFLNKDAQKAGTGAVITSTYDETDILFTMAFNITKLDLNDSKIAELWAATLVLEQLSKFQIKQLTYDC
ncbi:MAG: hypothetical protein ACRBDL_07315 [Alphaproteobacteria bacterium]